MSFLSIHQRLYIWLEKKIKNLYNFSFINQIWLYMTQLDPKIHRQFLTFSLPPRHKDTKGHKGHIFFILK